MESKKINQLATELAPDLSDLTIIGDPTTGISKKITLSQMASLFTGTVEEYANLAAFPLVGVADTIYVAKDTNVIYRWDSTAYVVLSPNIIASLVFNDANGFDGNIALVGSVATLTITTALTTGSVGFIGASGALLQDNANFFWDDTNNRLGLGTNAPTTALDVFGSGIIGRINGTSTNNAYLGFASASTNKWSIGNVESDHRFRIFSEANSAELITILQTGEFGIGIANPTTKFHIDGAASALIANLDANVSIAKSVSFRSDNSARINLEVSGTESGSNVGADFFLRTFTDAGSLIETPFTIVRSTGVTTIKSLTLTNVLSVANGGTGLATLTSNYLYKGNGTSALAISIISNNGSTASIDGFLNVGNAITSSAQININSNGSTASYLYFNGAGVTSNHTAITGNEGASSNLKFYTANTLRLTIDNAGAATYTENVLLAATKRLYLSGTSYIQEITAGTIRLAPAGNDSFDITSSLLNVWVPTIFDSTVKVNGTPVATSGILSVKTSSSTLGATADLGLLISNDGGINKLAQIGFGYSESRSGAVIGGIITNGAGSTSSALFFATRNSTDGTIAPTERLRITSGGFTKMSSTGSYNTAASYHEIRANTSGNWTAYISNIATSDPYGMVVDYLGTSPNGTQNEFFLARDTGGLRFAVRSNGGISNYQANNVNLSDERTKKEIFPLESYWDKFKELIIVKFKYKDQTHEDFNIGVIAQQVEKVAPEFIDIDGWDSKPKLDEEGNEIISEEEPLKSVYTSDLHHATIKVLQEAMAKIEILEKEVEILKAK